MVRSWLRVMVGSWFGHCLGHGYSCHGGISLSFR